MKKPVILLMCAASAFVSLEAQERATIKEMVTTMKTYPFSDPSLVPNPSALMYPYFRFDGFAAEGTDREWKSVVLENSYIRLSLFPEVGGKIWGAVDKTTGKEFIYNNHVAKFRDIAMRGPWASGGIELNFGIIGHAPTSTTPIDYYLEQKADGSVSCHIASYEWVTRTYWNVEVNLPKDRAYFTTTTTWFNQSDVDQPYYQWMNAGYKAAGNACFCYPGNHYIGHSGDAHNFPIDEEGHDLSWYKNNNFGSSKSNHVLGFYNDYNGVYWYDDDFGSIHHADFSDKLGMKIFLWGQARDGSIWEDLLTDTDGQYVELQSGRMFNQPGTNSGYSPYKHHAFAAQQTDRWTEYWFPVKGTKGVAKVSPVGALNVEREGNDLKLAFSPLQRLSTMVYVYDGQKEVARVPLEAEVLKTWKTSVPGCGVIDKGRLRVIIGSQELVYSEIKDDYLLDRPLTLPKDFDWNSTYGLFTQGEQLMNQKRYVAAEDYLRRCLEKENYFVPAINRLASLYLRQGRGAEAATLLKRSLSLNTYDAEANYLYGLYHQQKGQAAEAKAAFSIAAYTSAFRSAAYCKLGEIALKEADWQRAERYALRSIETNQMNFDARQVLMVAFRKTGQPKKAQEQIDFVLQQMPLYHMARYEEGLIRKNSRQVVNGLPSLVRNELPFETYMELAGWYESVGLIDEALELLAYAGDYPIAVYRQAYLLQKRGDEETARQCLDKARTLSPERVFPFRAATLPALEWAAKVDSKDWKINYYRALICYANQRFGEAVSLFDRCGTPDYAPFYLCRAHLHKEQHLPYRDDLLKAASLSSSWRTGFELLNEYAAAEEWQKVVEVGERYIQRYPDNYYLGLKLAKGYCETGDYKSSLALLRRLTVLPNEGAYIGRSVYREAQLYEAMDHLSHGRYKKASQSLLSSLEWPENLGVGKPYADRIDSRLEDYLMACIAKGRGRQSEAEAAFRKVAESRFVRSAFKAGNLLSALALRELGEEQRADQWVASWSKENSGHKVAKWCSYVYHRDYDAARKMLQDRQDNTDTTPWEISGRDNDFNLITRWVAVQLDK